VFRALFGGFAILGVVAAIIAAVGPWEDTRPPLLVAVALWLVTLSFLSALVAKRLARPLEEVARVADELGRGNLDARVEVSRPGRRRRGPRAIVEVDVVGDALNRMAERIAGQLEDQRALLAAVSHELRTPLARQRLLVEMAREGRTDALDEIEHEIVVMDALVADLLATARLDFSAITLVRLRPATLAAHALEAADLDLELLDADEDLPDVLADATLLTRALTNLVTNAERHGAGLARLRVRAESGELVFEAEDRGPGFRDGAEDRVFEPFVKGATTGSLGLGLALVRRIAEAHGGRAVAENRAEGGARVSLVLPEAGPRVEAASSQNQT